MTGPENVADRVKAVINEVVTLPKDVTMDYELSRLNMDSLDVVEIVQDLEEEFNLKIEDTAPTNWKTLGDVVMYIESL